MHCALAFMVLHPDKIPHPELLDPPPKLGSGPDLLLPVLPFLHVFSHLRLLGPCDARQPCTMHFAFSKILTPSVAELQSQVSSSNTKCDTFLESSGLVGHDLMCKK